MGEPASTRGATGGRTFTAGATTCVGAVAEGADALSTGAVLGAGAAVALAGSFGAGGSALVAAPARGATTMAVAAWLRSLVARTAIVPRSPRRLPLRAR